MRFLCVNYAPDENNVSPSTAYLVHDNWDDYGFKTTFGVHLVDREGVKHDLGIVRIMTENMGYGRVVVPDVFDVPLPPNYCSLGFDQNYYETLYALPVDLRDEYLVQLQDCVYNPEIWEKFRSNKAMRDSLLRSLDVRSVEITFRNLLQGRAIQTNYHFTFNVLGREDAGNGGLGIDFDVTPESMPPTNVHAIIGANGVGKTRLFAGMTHALIGKDPETTYPLTGELIFEENLLLGGHQPNRFANLVTVTFSAFDSFLPVHGTGIEGDIQYSYVGLKKRLVVEGQVGERVEIGIKSPEELAEEFVVSLSKCLSEPRRSRWLKMIDILSSDRGLRDLQVDQVLAHNSNEDVCERLKHSFGLLSSGHKIVLLTITKLVELVADRTLVLIDEPESHLHPPLLGSFIRAVSELLTTRNGVGILATHSPVVLQEVPKSCVTVLSRTGDTIVASRPEDETFAENVGVLTREAFGLEVTESGYHRMLFEASLQETYQEVLESFGHNIGAEGRAIVRALKASRGEN